MGSTLFGCEMEERVCNLNRRSCHLASLSKVQVQYKLPFNRGRLQKGQNPVHHKNEWKSCVDYFLFYSLQKPSSWYTNLTADLAVWQTSCCACSQQAA